MLYVALTRAKEKLILTGTVKDFEKAFLKWGSTADCDTEILPASRLRRAKSYLDWVMPAYLRHPARERLNGRTDCRSSVFFLRRNRHGGFPA